MGKIHIRKLELIFFFRRSRFRQMPGHRRLPPATIDADEMAICARFREARLAACASQAATGEKTGLTRDQVAGIESARSPLRFWPGIRFCAWLDLNPCWLANGQVPVNGWRDLGALPLAFEQIGERARFSEGWEKTSTGKLSRDSSLIAAWNDATEEIDDAKHDHNATEAYASGMAPAMEEAKQNQAMLDSLRREWEEQRVISETPTWEELRTRLKAATQKARAKTELARALEVTKQAVTEWLSGASAPTAARTLKLLRWVLAAESSPIESGSDVRASLPPEAQKANRHEKQPPKPPQKK